MPRKTTNRIDRTRTFEEKRTGKLMEELSKITEKLTLELSEELQKIKVKDFASYLEYESARKEIIKRFQITKKESLDAITKFYTN